MAENQNNEGCTHDCSTCTANCPSKNKESLLENLNELSSVKHVIAVVSGKGGVGKSLVTSMLSVLFARNNYKTAILDADITGPSIPKIFGLKGDIKGNGQFMFPLRTKTGIDCMSINLLLEEETKPVVWRGSLIAGAVKQFWTDVVWDGIDYMFVDCPPGTGDVPLTVFQSLPVEGIIIVSTPQDLVSMIVEKAYNMAQLMNIPVIGLVENMSGVICPDCGKKIDIFGQSKIDETAAKLNVPVLAKIPLDVKLSAACDAGAIEDAQLPYLENAVKAIVEHKKGDL